MMSKIPFDQSKLSPEQITRQNIRVGLMAELDAINLYEQLAANESDEKVKKVFEDIIEEEKTHLGEFSALLLEVDPEQAQEADAGEYEVEQAED